MKVAWRNARKIQDQSGEGVRSEDNGPTFNALLGPMPFSPQRIYFSVGR